MSDPPAPPSQPRGPRLRTVLPVLVAVAFVCGFAGGFAASYLHPGPPGTQGERGAAGVQGPQGSAGIQGPSGSVAPLPLATRAPVTTIISYNGNSNTPERGFPIATGAVYAISYTVKPTGACEFYFDVISPDGSTTDMVAGGFITVQRTSSGIDRLYLAPGNYSLLPGANPGTTACTWFVSVTTT